MGSSEHCQDRGVMCQRFYHSDDWAQERVVRHVAIWSQTDSLGGIS
jgi:hypothetical protein